jgi:hypothetical protein
MNYAQIDASLKTAFAREDAAFLHGFWHGLNASHAEWSLKLWLDALIEEFDISSIPAELLKAFQQIHVDSQAQLDDDPLTMTLLIPDDETALTLRALALQQWCQGYLYGLGLGERIKNWKALPKEFREWIEDITHISQLDENSVTDCEEDEASFVDLSEYVRMAAAHIAEHIALVATPKPEPETIH